MPHYDPDRHRRRSVRWRGYAYSSEGAYFVTTTLHNGVPLLGRVIDERVRLSPAGEMVASVWSELPQRFPFVSLDAYVVMPDHVHGILILHNNSVARAEPLQRTEDDGLPDPELPGHARGTTSNSLGRVMQAFKSLSTRAYGEGVRNAGWPAYEGRFWQRSFYDRVLRNDRELWAIREYIRLNPAKWAMSQDASGQES